MMPTTLQRKRVLCTVNQLPTRELKLDGRFKGDGASIGGLIISRTYVIEVTIFLNRLFD